MPSRTLIGRIDAKMERPEEREFQIPDLPAHLMANRKRLAIAALMILRAYHVAGRPRQNIARWGGFDQWSHEIREPLVWLGMADPCRTR
jgi:putative DNA primase/helicase